MVLNIANCWNGIAWTDRAVLFFLIGRDFEGLSRFMAELSEEVRFNASLGCNVKIKMKRREMRSEY